jgi:hypothetical protein
MAYIPIPFHFSLLSLHLSHHTLSYASSSPHTPFLSISHFLCPAPFLYPCADCRLRTDLQSVRKVPPACKDSRSSSVGQGLARPAGYTGRGTQGSGPGRHFPTRATPVPLGAGSGNCRAPPERRVTALQGSLHTRISSVSLVCMCVRKL